MNYRKFGSGGAEISALGFGCMRLPEEQKDGKWTIAEEKAIPMLRKAYALGVNYFDTAYMYCHGNSEYTVGKAIQPFREKVMLATKFPHSGSADRAKYRATLEEQLKKLDTPYIDYYHFHGIDLDVFRHMQKAELLEEAQKAKDEGLIRHISFSFHGRAENMKTLIDEGNFETVLCQYNLLDRSNEEALRYAAQKGLGTVAMGPVAGGRLSAPSEVIAKLAPERFRSTPELALRFALANPRISCALSGMGTMEMVLENTAVASDAGALTEAELTQINRTFLEYRKLADLYCTGCNYCMPCPKNVHIPRIFGMMNNHRVYGLTAFAKEQFAGLGKNAWVGAHPDDCAGCSACEAKCPQKIKIREQLAEVTRELG